MPSPARIRLGVILGAHGVRGEVKVRSFTESPKELFSYSLTDATGVHRFALEHRGGRDDAMIARIEGIADRNTAEALKGTELFVAAKDLPKGRDSWYADELEGLEARLIDGRVYGHVTQLYNFGAGDIVEVALPGGKTEMLPLREPFVTEVEPDKGYIVVTPPEYVEEE